MSCRNFTITLIPAYNGEYFRLVTVKKKLYAMDGEAAQIEKLRSTAYHEAGHAVMAIWLGRLLQKVTVVAGKSALGTARLGLCQMQKGRSKASKDWLEEEVLICFAGMVAQSHYTGQQCQQSAAGDLRAVERLLAQNTTNQKQFEKLYRRLLDKTEHVLGEAALARAIELVVDELIQRKTVSGRAIRHFMELAERQAKGCQ